MLYEKILEYKEELFDDLNRLLSIESVDGARDEDCAAALDFIIKRAEDFGLTAEKVTAKSAHVDLGKGGKLCGVLSHLDVVPAGNNWTVNPYALTERGGRLYGRGVADDKGAALVNLYCLRALKELGVEGKNTLRAIYGTAEETGMSDMDGYFAQKRLPDLAFTPDSEYGVCYAEKGILQLEVSTPTNEAKVLSQFHAGKAINAVPDLAYVMLDSSGYDEQLLMRLADASEGNFEFNYTIDGLMIISRGKAAHACEPQKGFNAAAALIDLITQLLYRLRDQLRDQRQVARTENERRGLGRADGQPRQRPHRGHRGARAVRHPLSRHGQRRLCAAAVPLRRGEQPPHRQGAAP